MLLFKRHSVQFFPGIRYGVPRHDNGKGQRGNGNLLVVGERSLLRRTRGQHETKQQNAESVPTQHIIHIQFHTRIPKNETFVPTTAHIAPTSTQQQQGIANRSTNGSSTTTTTTAKTAKTTTTAKEKIQSYRRWAYFFHAGKETSSNGTEQRCTESSAYKRRQRGRSCEYRVTNTECGRRMSCIR